MRDTVRTMLANFEIKIINISRVVQILRFGHETNKIHKFNPPLDRAIDKVFYLIFLVTTPTEQIRVIHIDLKFH